MVIKSKIQPIQVYIQLENQIEMIPPIMDKDRFCEKPKPQNQPRWEWYPFCVTKWNKKI